MKSKSIKQSQKTNNLPMLIAQAFYQKVQALELN